MRQARKTLLMAVVASLPVFAWGLTPMNESQLSGVAGQGGVTITLKLPNNLSWNQTVYDRNGVPADVSGNASVLGINTSLAPGKEGALVMTGIALKPGGAITLTADAGQSTAGPVFNIAVAIPSGSQLVLPNLQLSVPTTVGGWALNAAQTKTIYSAGTTLNPGVTVNIGATNLNLQLGNVAQTMSMVKPTSPTTTTTVTYKPLLLTSLSITNGVTIQNLAVTDVSNPSSATYSACTNGGATKVDCAQTIANVYVNDNNGTLAATKGVSNLTVQGLAMSITTNGLVFAVSQLGDPTNGVNVQMDNVHLGDSTIPGLGNAYLQGLKLGSDATLTIAGH